MLPSPARPRQSHQRERKRPGPLCIASNMTPDQELLDLLRALVKKLNDVDGELDELNVNIEILNCRLQTLAGKIPEAKS